MMTTTYSAAGRPSRLIMNSPPKPFVCQHCQQPSESTARNAKYCQARACQAARQAANERKRR